MRWPWISRVAYEDVRTERDPVLQETIAQASERSAESSPTRYRSLGYDYDPADPFWKRMEAMHRAWEQRNP